MHSATHTVKLITDGLGAIFLLLGLGCDLGNYQISKSAGPMKPSPVMLVPLLLNCLGALALFWGMGIFEWAGVFGIVLLLVVDAIFFLLHIFCISGKTMP